MLQYDPYLNIGGKSEVTGKLVSLPTSLQSARPTNRLPSLFITGSMIDNRVPYLSPNELCSTGNA